MTACCRSADRLPLFVPRPSTDAISSVFCSENHRASSNHDRSAICCSPERGASPLACNAQRPSAQSVHCIAAFSCVANDGVVLRWYSSL
eukprot:1657645-Prymnesium_polylepis.1